MRKRQKSGIALTIGLTKHLSLHSGLPRLLPEFVGNFELPTNNSVIYKNCNYSEVREGDCVKNVTIYSEEKTTLIIKDKVGQ